MRFITLPLLLSTVLCHSSSAQVIGALDLYNRLESHLNALNSTLRQHQNQIDNIMGDLLIQQIGHEDDITKLMAQLKTAEGKLSSLEKTSKENSELITVNSIQLVSTELQLGELASQMDQLNATNQLWRSNFQVVNRTFSELRKKFAFVVPVIPGSVRN